VEHSRGRSASEAQGGEAESGPTGRLQRAGFSIFLDQMTDAQGQLRWETRLYHAESGVETTLPGVSPEQWIAWIIDQVAGELPAPVAGAGRRQAVLEVASVEILDVTVEEGPDDRSGGLHSIRAQVVIQLAGLGPVEREIGSRVLQGIARSTTASTRARPGTT